MSENLLSDDRMKARRPGVAAVATLVAPGLGHLYAGRPLYGVAIYTALVALSYAVIWRVFNGGAFWVAVSALAWVGAILYLVSDAARTARRAGPSYVMRWYNRWWVYAGFLVISVVVREPLRAVLPQALYVPAASMEPTLLVGDYILAAPLQGRSPSRGDIVLFIFPEDRSKLFVKRVVGLPGETVEVRGEQVIINGVVLDEPYANVDGATGRPKALHDFGPVIPPDHYFVLGDARNRSYDSRSWGPLSADLLVGRVGSIYFSWDTEKRAVRWGRLGSKVE